MPEIVEMPKLGMTMEEGTIISWYKKEGEKIGEGEILAEIMTDKTNIEIESPASGIVYKLLAKEGEVKKVGEPIAIIKLEGEDENSIGFPEERVSEKTVTEEKPPEKEKKTKKVEGEGIAATPYARYIAKKMGINIEEFSKERKEIITGELLLTTSPASLTPIQKAMAKKMEESAKIPQFTLWYEFDAETLLTVNKKLKENGYKSSITPLFLKAIAHVMNEYPLFNATFNEDKIFPSDTKNIGIAVQTERGLMVPVLKDIDSLGKDLLFDTYNTLIEKTKNGKLDISDTEGATFTVSNLGMYGVKSFRALLVPGQMAILAIGAIQNGIEIGDKGIFIKKIINLSITCDHRIIEGAYAAKFMISLKEVIERNLEEILK